MVEKFTELESALKRVGAGQFVGLYISIIDSQAERADIEDYRQQSEIDPYGPILDALNTFLRSLRRSTLSSGKIGKKLSSLPEPVFPFIGLELTRRLDKKIDLENEDWSKTKLRDALEESVRHVRLWFCDTDAERLDVHNGLLLAAHLDAAFDAGLITFEMDGSLVVSPALADEDNDRLGLPGLLPLQGLRPRHQPYLTHHRDVVFQAAIND